MKSVIFKFSGDVDKGDLVVITATHPRGGASNAKYYVKGREVTAEIKGEEVTKVVIPAETPEVLAEKLAFEINFGKEYIPNQFKAQAKGDLLIIACSDNVNEVIFFSQYDGKNTLKVEEL
jgi:hypothetical protein